MKPEPEQAIPMNDDICPHCKMSKKICNPSGYCNHVYYPESCEVCKMIMFEKIEPPKEQTMLTCRKMRTWVKGIPNPDCEICEFRNGMNENCQIEKYQSKNEQEGCLNCKHSYMDEKINKLMCPIIRRFVQIDFRCENYLRLMDTKQAFEKLKEPPKAQRIGDCTNCDGVWCLNNTTSRDDVINCTHWQSGEPPKEQDTITRLRQIAIDCYEKISAIPVNAVENTKGYSEFVVAVRKFAKAEKEYLEKAGVDEEIEDALQEFGERIYQNVIRGWKIDDAGGENMKLAKQTLDRLYGKKFRTEIVDEFVKAMDSFRQDETLIDAWKDVGGVVKFIHIEQVAEQILKEGK